jgi:DNA mismatch repair protein MLH3
MQQSSLERLDAPTRVKLRSSQILTSLPQIVSELVQNSLDAGASAVDIGIDSKEWICWVKDNGCGISKDGLSVLSKCSEEGRYGV